LRHADGRLERHLLRGAEYLASQDGAMLLDPPPLLAPFPLLQAGEAESLRGLLHLFAVDLTASSLGRVGEIDAFVLGRVPVQQQEPAEDLGSAGGLSGRFWVAVEGLRALRLEQADGLHWEFGTLRRWGKITAPSAITLRRPGDRPLRMEIRSIEAAEAPMTEFQVDWLGLVEESFPQIEENPGPNKR